jgi:hypothetical protein
MVDIHVINLKDKTVVSKLYGEEIKYRVIRAWFHPLDKIGNLEFEPLSQNSEPIHGKLISYEFSDTMDGVIGIMDKVFTEEVIDKGEYTLKKQKDV